MEIEHFESMILKDLSNEVYMYFNVPAMLMLN